MATITESDRQPLLLFVKFYQVFGSNRYPNILTGLIANDILKL